MKTPPSPASLEAFLVAIASFRAVKGSYEMHELRDLSYRLSLDDSEWKKCLFLYESKLQDEKLRNETQRIAHAKIKANLQPKIEQLKKILKKIPEIIDVWLVNSYTFGALKPTSDIDLLVVTHPKAIWLARLKLTALLELAGIRRKKGDIEEQFCLSFFVTTESLDMSFIARENDIHFAYWAAKAEPLFSPPRVAWLQHNQWLKNFFPYKYKNLPQNINLDVKPLSHIRKCLNFLVKIPLKIRTQTKAAKLGPESSIVINDRMLKFHNIDRRDLYKKETMKEFEVLKEMIK